MVRLSAFLSALVMSLAGAWLVARGVENVMLFVHVHPLPKSSASHIAIFIGIFAGLFPGIFVALKSRGHQPIVEDNPLTPLVRRSPSGVREL